jgi:hypothetical protein
VLDDVEQNLEDMLGEDVENLQGYMYILDAPEAILTHWLYDSEQYHRYSPSEKRRSFDRNVFCLCITQTKNGTLCQPHFQVLICGGKGVLCKELTYDHTDPASKVEN